MKNLGISLLLLFVLSCNDQKKSSETSDKKDSTVNTNNRQPADKPAASFSLAAFDKKTTPLKDSVKETLIDGAAWTDAGGEFTVLLGQTESKHGENIKNPHIYAYCYKKEGGSWKQQWIVQDKIENCEVDATCEFFPGSLTVTDNDKNNIGEVTFLYKLSCRGDVSPDDKKLIMYEGAKKFAIRGTTLIDDLGDKKFGGEKKVDASFNTAPKALLDFANQQWDKFGLAK